MANKDTVHCTNSLEKLEQLSHVAPVAESAEVRLARFEKIIGELITSSESRTTVLHAFRRLDVPPMFAANLAREAIHKLPSQERDYVEQTEFDRFHSPREKLLRWIVWAFVAVLIGSVVPLAVIAIMRASTNAQVTLVEVSPQKETKSQDVETSTSKQHFTIPAASIPDSSTAQILLTVFTTTAGFLAGLLSPNPMDQQKSSAFPASFPTIGDEPLAKTKVST